MFERGFKSWCERYAIDVRKTLQLKQHEKLDPYLLAKHLEVRVWKTEDVPGLSEPSRNLLLSDPGASVWSAVTLVEREKRLIVLNSSHSHGRQSSDLMHEMAHLILSHLPETLVLGPNGVALRNNYDKRQEQEADWLAGCLLLPRPALVQILKEDIDLAEAAIIFGVSRAMLNYRLAVTGVKAQFT